VPPEVRLVVGLTATVQVEDADSSTPALGLSRS